MSDRPVGNLDRWREVGDRVFVRRHREFDLNIGLVVGDGGCLVVDTHASEAAGEEVAAAVRQLSSDPWAAVDTHAHFDHCFGNTAFRPAPIWGHRRCAENLRVYGEVQRHLMAAAARSQGRPEAADRLEETLIDPPDRLVEDGVDLTVGGRPVLLRHLGRGHTDNDLVVVVPDAGVLFAGDLVEEGAPPAFEDAFPLDWPATLDAMVGLAGGPVVPGHGDVVDRPYVVAQGAEIARTAEVARAAYAEGRPVESVLAEVPFPPAVARTAVERAFRQLRGDPPYDPPGVLLNRPAPG